ncbi:MAG: DegT/DnrJ/EryC1/StrS family aminotransferase [Sphaerochaetaceae bacterium]|nr:DegT/DnrJ/EryC1/StrS family aminotransferase [Sphaerochaetaceae bacterium]
MSIQVTKSSMPNYEEYIEEIKELWDTHWLTNNGVKHKKFESLLIEYLNVNNLTLYVNGHLALENIISAMNLKGEIITTPFTFISTTQAIIRNNIKPVFCDINDENYTIDVDNIESLITEKTSAILPVHVYGNVCDVKRIYEIAQKYNLKVIYDAAHCFGVKVNGKGIGTFGDASMFSFHATKVFNSIEGGALTYNDSSLKSILNSMKNFGIVDAENINNIGFNGKMNEFQAAMGICNLRHIDAEVLKRKQVFERYLSNLENIKGIKLLREQKGVKKNYAYFPVVFDGYKLNRDEVFEELKKNDIYARKYFYPLANSFDCLKNYFDNNNTPVAKYISERVLTLPLYADLSLDDVDRICNIIVGKRR